MSDEEDSGVLRERTHAASEADRQAAESSKYTPKVTIDEPSRKLPSEMKAEYKKIIDPDRSIKVPINYSTMITALACVVLTAVFCYYCVVHGPVSAWKKGFFLLFLMVYWCIFMVYFVPPLPQTQLYHDFADQRSLNQLIPSLKLMNLPNALDVLSNIPFLFVGLHGLFLLLLSDTIVLLTGFEKFAWIIFFASSAGIGIGSSYYHLKPSNATLAWDRGPMSVAFSVLLSLLIDERIDSLLGMILFLLLLLAGIGSCVYWHYTDDLRAYILVQFYPTIYIPVLLLISPSVYSHTLYYIYTCILYGLAKVCESADKPIFRMTFNNVSGHTLKHLFSALGMFVMLRMLEDRVVL